MQRFWLRVAPWLSTFGKALATTVQTEFGITPKEAARGTVGSR